MPIAYLLVIVRISVVDISISISISNACSPNILRVGEEARIQCILFIILRVKKFNLSKIGCEYTTSNPVALCSK